MKLSSRHHSAAFPAHKNYIQVKLQVGELEVGVEVGRGKRARKRLMALMVVPVYFPFRRVC
jgi:hypothetical protein